MKFLLSLPHPLVEIWVLWLIAVPFALQYLFRKHDAGAQLRRTKELMNVRELGAVGCVAGFILLTFITVLSVYLIMKAKGLN